MPLPEPRDILPLAILIAVGAFSLWLIWRVVVVGARARGERSARRRIGEVAGRAERSTSELARLVDELRRRKLEPGAVLPALATGSATLRRCGDEASGLVRAPVWGARASALVDDVGRAERAVELIVHGAELLADPHGDWGEGETSVKRGYLNLVHAGDALRGRREQLSGPNRSRA